MERLKVLVSAHEFQPYQGSECAVGWNIVTRLAKYHEITVLYASGSQFSHNNYLHAVNSYFETNAPITGLTYINIDQPLITKLLSYFNSSFFKRSNIGLPILYFLGYKLWQRKAYRTAILLHKKEKFDIAHQLTQIAFREPGYLFKLGIPFVWGPTGGNINLPREYFYLFSWKSRLFENIRRYANYYQFHFVRRTIQANKLASLIYCFSKEDAFKFNKRATGRIKLMLETGSYILPNRQAIEKESMPILTAIWCGHLIERKAPELLLHAIANSQLIRDKLSIIIVGSGPLKTSLLKLAKDINLKNIKWISKVKHEDIFDLMATSDFLIHTSYREGTPHVILEALSTGIPVICHDVSGMGIAVNETCGIKIPLRSPEESVIGFQKAIEQLILDQDLLEKLKVGALKRTRELSWDFMVETIASDYLECRSPLKNRTGD